MAQDPNTKGAVALCGSLIKLSGLVKSLFGLGSVTREAQVVPGKTESGRKTGFIPIFSQAV